MELVAQSRRRIQALSPYQRDLSLAAILGAGSLLENLGAEAWSLVLAPLAPLPVALRRRAPLVMAALLFTIHVVGDLAVPLPLHGRCVVRGAGIPWSGIAGRSDGATTGSSDQGRDCRGKGPPRAGVT